MATAMPNPEEFFKSYHQLIEKIDLRRKEHVAKKKEKKLLESQAETLTRDLEKLQIQTSKMEERNTTLVKNLKDLKHEKASKHDEYVLTDTRFKYYETCVVNVKKYMGLQMKRSGECTLLILFTKINPKYPENRFWFELEVGDIYKFCDCYPAINHEPLLDNLNRATAAVYRFVSALRRAFKDSCI